MRLRLMSAWSRPISRWLLQTVPKHEAWERVQYDVPSRCYGEGFRGDFRWYLSGECLVKAEAPNALRDWLLDCEYVRDAELYRRNDYWQHPAVFEQIRRGDCEDFALWTWRRLAEMGHKAELVAGRWRQADGSWTGHVWVTFEWKGRTLLFDPVIRDRSRMIRPLRSVQKVYLPEVSVDQALDRYAYWGYLNALEMREPRDLDESGVVTGNAA